MEQIYFSEALTEKLRRIAECPFSVLEAPAGYGKTTAAHRALDGLEEPVYWYTVVESIPDTSFRWFVRNIARADEDAAGQLASLGYLNRSNADQAAQIIAQMRVREPMTLVFDNFQYALANWQPQILDSLAKRGSDGLRTVFISQSFGRHRGVITALEESVCSIRSRDLLLSERDIQAFAARMGVDVTAAEAKDIRERTDGWVAAVSLCLKHGAEAMQRSDARDMDDLLYGYFWMPLTDGQREMMLRISLFDRLSVDMLQSLLPEDVIPGEERAQLLRRAPLVRRNEARGEFYPHEILLHFLRGRLNEADEAFRRDVYRRAGEVYQRGGMTRAAVNCYYHAREYARILSCRLVCLITEDFDGVSYTELARAVLAACPDDARRQYPLSLLRLCYALYAGCAFADFEREMRRVYELLEQAGNGHMIGEWHLLYALSDFPDLEKMERHYLRAEALLEHPSDLFIREEPFLFGCTSMWYLFYNRPGTMLETADVMDRVMNRYNRLTAGHGAGAAELYRGEAYSVQGRFEESDIQAYTAAFLAEQSGNASATYGAALLLGINAIYRADMVSLQKAVEFLENKAQGFAYLQGRMLNTYMVETVRGYLLGLMMETGRSALWTQGEADTLGDLTFTNFMIKTCRITDLLLKKEYKRAIASVESSLRLDGRLISTPTRNFMYCGLTLCYLAIGRPIRAAEYMDQSLTLAEQDKNYTFLACFRKYFQVLFLMPQIAVRHSRAIREIRALDIRYNRADESHIFAMLEAQSAEETDLTEREREVAELASQGLRNREIAERLFISENTVKHHLKIAFQKMNIDRRSKLVEMLR